MTTAATEEVTEASAEEVTEAASEEETAAPTEEVADEIEIPVEEEGEVDEVLTTGAEVPEESMGTLNMILVILEVITSIALVLVVLLQSGKEAGLSGAISGNSDSYMNNGGRASLDKKLASATKWIALVWILVTLALCLV